MQQFIDNEYYILCETRQEAQDFYEACKTIGLAFATRWDVEDDLLNQDFDETPYVFAHNWHEGEPNEGISFWENNRKADGERPIVPWSNIDRKQPANVEDFLNLL